jgi:hypothetical protein
MKAVDIRLAVQFVPGNTVMIMLVGWTSELIVQILGCGNVCRLLPATQCAAADGGRQLSDHLAVAVHMCVHLLAIAHGSLQASWPSGTTGFN